MTLSIDNTIDPLAVINNGRQLASCPWHFVKIESRQYNVTQSRDWIWKNLTGRFFVGTEYLAFEDPAEASMFVLVGDQFRVDDNF